MPRYDFECQGCGRRQERIFTMSSRPPAVPCACGLEAIQVILSVPESWVKNRPYEFRKDKIVGNNGKLAGRTAQQQHEGYRRHFDGIATKVKRLNRSGGRRSKDAGGFQYLGGMPGEMADSIGQQEGDKEAVAKDPVGFLKKTGLYVGEGD